jgi:hypothetical protein
MCPGELVWLHGQEVQSARRGGAELVKNLSEKARKKASR